MGRKSKKKGYMYPYSWFTLLYSRNQHNIVKQLCFCLVTKPRPTLCNPMDSSPPDSSAPGILQARILERMALSLTRGLLNSGTEPVSLALAGDSWPLSHQGNQRNYTPIKINQNKTKTQHVTRLPKNSQWLLITPLNENSPPSNKLDGLAPLSSLLAYHSLHASLWVSHWERSVWTNTPKPFCLKILDQVVSSAWKVFPLFPHIWLLSVQTSAYGLQLRRCVSGAPNRDGPLSDNLLHCLSLIICSCDSIFFNGNFMFSVSLHWKCILI